MDSTPGSAAGRPRARTSNAARSVEVRSQSVELVSRSITHELRQPLSLILGYAELLAGREFGPDERGTIVAEIRQAARRLSASLDLLERSETLKLITYSAAAELQVLDLTAAGGRDRA